MPSTQRLSILTFIILFTIILIITPTSVHSAPVASPVSKVSNISEDWGVKITNPDPSPDRKFKRSYVPAVMLLGRTMSPSKCGQPEGKVPNTNTWYDRDSEDEDGVPLHPNKKMVFRLAYSYIGLGGRKW